MAISYSLFKTADAYGLPSDGVAASSTDTYYSKRWSGDHDWGLHVQTTGTLTGTWTLWASDKPQPSLTDDTDWVDMSAHADFVETNPAGSTTKWRVNSTLIKATWLRLKYVNASGTGTIYAWAMA